MPDAIDRGRNDHPTHWPAVAPMTSATKTAKRQPASHGRSFERDRWFERGREDDRLRCRWDVLRRQASAASARTRLRSASVSRWQHSMHHVNEPRD